MTCHNCGADESQVIPVWEDTDCFEEDEQPKFIGCKSCNQMMRTRLLRDEDDEIPPQARLSDHEIARLSIGNQHSADLSIVEWQCVKGAAVYYGVRDWTSKVDPTLTCEENISLMEQAATRHRKKTLRETREPIKDEQ